METENMFADYTRSASFAFSLSQPQINRLLRMERSAAKSAVYDDLERRYPWWTRHHSVNFGEIDSAIASHTDSTMRSLIRKGLVRIEWPEKIPFSYSTVFLLTEPGALMCQLLAAAGFTIPPDEPPGYGLIPPHPDDRITIRFDGRPSTRPRDRRLDIMVPGDEPYLSALRHDTYTEDMSVRHVTEAARAALRD